MKFDEFPKPGQTTPILNTNFDRLYYGGKAWNIVYDLMMLGLPVYPVLAYSDARFEPEFQRAAERFQMPTDGIFRSPQGNYEFLTCYVLEDKHKAHITLGGYHSNAPSLDLAELKRDHVPVKQENSDARTAKERMQEGARVCSVRFTNTDSFAVCTVLDEGSRQLAVKNCRGGNAYRHHCKALLKKVEASRAFTDKDNVSQPNRKYYMHLKHLNEHYAHQVSKEIIDFCKENHTGILVLPEYDENFSRISMYRSGNYSPLHLSIRIRNYLKYKAWAEGILVLELRADGTEKQCSICGATGKKQGSIFICQNGHQVNRFLNGARNLGRKCQESFRKNNKPS